MQSLVSSSSCKRFAGNLEEGVSEEVPSKQATACAGISPLCTEQAASILTLAWGAMQEIAGSLEEAVSEEVPQQAGRGSEHGNVLSLQLAPTLALHKALRRSDLPACLPHVRMLPCLALARL